MATRAETSVVYAAGVVQGIALVTFPAASTILTDPAEYDLSSTQYGTLFLPQVVTAITAALLSMSLLLLSQFFTDDQSAAFVLLLLATASLGAGFGLTVPALNTLTAAFHSMLAALVAVAMGAWSFAVAMRRPSPPSLHPLPGHPAR
jgi:hypothetical protein